MNRSVSNLFAIAIVSIGGAAALIIALCHHEGRHRAVPVSATPAPAVEWHQPGDHPIRAVRVPLHVDAPSPTTPPAVYQLVDATDATPGTTEDDPVIADAIAKAEALTEGLGRAKWTALEKIGATDAEVDQLLGSDEKERAEVDPHVQHATESVLRQYIETARAEAAKREDGILSEERGAELRAAIVDALGEE